MGARLLAVVLAAVAVGGLAAVLKPEERGGLTQDEAVAFVHEVFEGTDVACGAGDDGWLCAYTYREAPEVDTRGRLVPGALRRIRSLIDDSPYPVTGDLH